MRYIPGPLRYWPHLTAMLTILLLVPPSLGQDEDRLTVRQDADVTTITTPGVPRFSGELFRYELLLTLKQDPQIWASLLTRPTGIHRLPDGHYLVSDMSRLVVFDENGQFVEVVGRQGGGPEEFGNAALLMDITPDGFTILDWASRGLKEYTSDRKLIRTRRMASQGRGWPNHIHQMADGSYLEVASGAVTPDREHSITWVRKFSSTGEQIGYRSSDPVRTRELLRLPSGALWPVVLPFAEYPMTHYVPGQGVLMSPGGLPELLWYDLQLQLTKKIVVQGLSDELTISDRERFEEDWSQLRYHEHHRDIMREKLPETKPGWTFIYVDDAGYIWLRVSDDVHRWIAGNRTYRYRVLSPQGEYLGVTTTPTELHRTNMHTNAAPLSIRDGLMMVIVEDEESGERQGRVYRIQAIPPGFSYP